MRWRTAWTIRFVFWGAAGEKTFGKSLPTHIDSRRGTAAVVSAGRGHRRSACPGGVGQFLCVLPSLRRGYPAVVWEPRLTRAPAALRDLCGRFLGVRNPTGLVALRRLS